MVTPVMDGRGPAPTNVIRSPLPALQQAGAPTGTPQQLTGLTGFEAGINQGVGGAVGALQQGQGIVDQSLMSALNLLNQGNQAIGQQVGSGVNALAGGERRGLDAINQAVNQGVAGLDPFVQPGVQGQQNQLALSGALGQEAFNNALINNPATNFLREQGMNAVTNASAATGGLGGGNVLKELTKFGQGLAAQDLQNQFDRSGVLANQGLQAAGQQGQLRGQQAGLSSSLIGNIAANKANLFGQQAGLTGALSQAGANTLGQRANLSSNIAGMGADLFSGAGGALADARLRTGENLANSIGGISGGIADLQNQQGVNLGNIIGQGTSSLADIFKGAGVTLGQSNQDLATILANLSVGAGTGLSGISQNSANIAQSGANAQGAQQAQTGGAIIGALASIFSDARLKENITPEGKIDGYEVFSWKWKDTEVTREVAGKSGFGVLAQLVEMVNPSAVGTHDSGYKMINLGAL